MARVSARARTPIGLLAAGLLAGLLVAGAMVAGSGLARAQAEQPAPAAEPGVWVVDAVDESTSKWVAEATGTSTVTIPVGDTVEWHFDRATMSHDLTSLDDDSDWDPPVQEYRDPRGAPFSYTFTEPGTYRYVCVIHGATMTGTVVVAEDDGANQPPTAEPYVDPRTGAAPLYVHLEARADDPDGDPLAYRWDFGDGSAVSIADHAHHSYAAPGRYFATLTVSDGHGGTFAREFAITVTGGQGPLVTANVSPTSGEAPVTVVGVGTAEDPQGDEMTYRWDFGDPASPDDVADTARASYTYPRPGSYTATFTATDTGGHTGRKTFAIVVGGEDPAPELPEVAATATPDDGTAPLTVQLSAEVTTTGTFSEFAAGAGVFDIAGTATMTRRHGSTTTTLDVDGLAPDSAHMAHVHEQACADQSAGAHFRFDDTAPFGEENEIWLGFTSGSDGTSGPVEVEDPQRAGEKALSIVVHGPHMGAERIACADLAPSTAGLGYAWDFGDDTTGTGPDPQHTYDRPGTYTAVVEVSGHHGTPAIAEVEVVVGEAADTLAPRTTLAGGPSGTTRSRSAAFRLGSSEAGSRWQCRLDGAAWRACGSLWRLGALRDGRHEVRVRAIDAAGNVDATPASRSWVVDTTGPAVRSASPQGTVRDRTPTVRATVTDALSRVKAQSLRLRLDGRLVRGVRWDGAHGRLAWTPTRPVGTGRHTVRLTVADAVGNQTVREWRFTVPR